LAAVLASVPLLIIVPRGLLHLADAQQYPWPAVGVLLGELELLLMSNALGIMLVFPLGLVLLTRHLRQQLLRPGTLLLAGGILLVLGLPQVTLMQEYLVLPFIAWMALRSKLGGAVLGMVVTGAGVAVLSRYGLGPFADIPADQAMTSLAAYILSLSLPLLVLGCVLAEWDEQNSQLENTVRERTLALETANRELFQLANRDSLTNAANRRYFLDEAGKVMQRALRYGEPLSLGILDLDHFKQINDRYGHAIGDQVLINVVNCCQASLRTSDLLGRWGGEAFVVLLPGIAAADAVRVFEKLLGAVRKVSIDPGCPSLTVSFSAGVVQWDTKESLEHLLSLADAALYQAKHEGRNQIRLAVA
jgi:diguanylate cyclase (GGDEF)-like protein